MGKYKSIWIGIGVIGVISIIVAVLFLYSKNTSLSDILNHSEESPCETQIHQAFEGKVVKVKRYLYNNYKNRLQTKQNKSKNLLILLLPKYIILN